MKIGIFLPHLGNNQLAVDTVSQLNQAVAQNAEIYPSIFIKEIKPHVLKSRTIITGFDKLYNYDGHIITTNLDTTYIALQCRMLKSINFYISELEWLYNIGSYLNNITIYNNPNINIYTPSIEYSNAIANYCNRQSHLINGYNLNEIITRIRTTDT